MTTLMDQYLEYISDTEPDVRFHRWSFMTGIGAILGRRVFLPFGHQNIYPTMYTILIGHAGDRKSTAIKLAAKLFRASGYQFFAASRTTKEKFLLDLEGRELDRVPGEEEDLVFYDEDAPREAWICADELMDFIGVNNLNFVTTLGTLWDFDEEFYTDKVKNSKSVKIKDPTISMLGGITPQNFALTFPPEILGQGFFSRILLIHGERTSKRITIPKRPDKDLEDYLKDRLRLLASTVAGPLEVTPEAFKILDDIYQRDLGGEIPDSRFETYSRRRYTHLLKVAAVTTGMHETRRMEPEHIIEANTVLSFAEHFMPQALGEFGKSRNSLVANKIMDALYKAAAAGDVLTFAQLQAVVSTDIDRVDVFSQVLSSLISAKKIQVTGGESRTVSEQGFLPVRRQMNLDQLDYVDLSYLTREEREEVGK